MSLRLAVPSSKLAEAFLDMNEEFRKFGEDSYRPWVRSDTFEAYLQKLRSQEEEAPEGLVPMSVYWLADETERIYGEVRFRHYLNESLRVEGGHIGYTIRPTERRKGYGTAILSLMLEIARIKGYDRILITCDTDNVPSARIIERHGGVLEGYGISDHSGKQVSRYWIEL